MQVTDLKVPAASAPILKTTYEVVASIRNLYTGGKIVISSDGRFLFCLCDGSIHAIELSSGKVVKKFSEEGTEIISFCLSPDAALLVTTSRTALLRIFDVKSGDTRRVIKIPRYPVLDLCFDPSGSFVATASSDRTIKVWDVEQGFCTHNFTGHTDIIHCVLFHPNSRHLILFSASEDSSVRAWDLHSSRGSVLENHMGAVSSLALSPDGAFLVSGGRDRVVNVWDARSFVHLRTIPVYESVEGVYVLPAATATATKKSKKARPNSSEEDSGVPSLRIATVGDKGILRVFENQTRECVQSELPPTAARSLLHLTVDASTGALVVVTSERNIAFYNPVSLEVKKVLVGYNDQVIDIKYALGGSHIVVATNANDLRRYELDNFDCRMLSGHTDVVMSVDVNRTSELAASCSKDHTARVWRLDTLQCIALCEGHTEAVGALAFAKQSNDFVITGSKDRTIKLWDLSSVDTQSGEAKPVRARFTQRAHDRDINSIAVAPNDKLFATASQDKTIKLWNTADMTPLATLKGHRRGVWCVEFSSVDQVLASSSADKTIKLWSVKDYSCLKTFEGHETSVLRVSFVTSGIQLVTTSSDGLLKLWNIKTGECVNTFEGHTDKIWAMAVRSGDNSQMVTGGADSTIHIWADRTREQKQNQAAAAEQLVLRQEELANCLRAKNYRKAVKLAFLLDQPLRMAHIFEQMVIHAPNQISQIVADFKPQELLSCLKYIRDWNTNAKFTAISQQVLNAVLMHYTPEDLEPMRAPLKELIVSLIPYTDRHFQRLTKLLQRSFLLDFTINSMQVVVPAGTAADGMSELIQPLPLSLLSVATPSSLPPDEDDLEEAAGSGIADETRASDVAVASALPPEEDGDKRATGKPKKPRRHEPTPRKAKHV